MKIILVCASLLTILYGALSFNVSVARMRMRNSQLTKGEVAHAVRIHGNAAEYIPLFIALLIFLSLSPSNWFIDFIVVTATMSRILHAIGMFCIKSIQERHPLRFIGALGTYFSLFAFGGILLAKATEVVAR